MQPRTAHYTMEEHERRGRTIYESQIQSQVEADHRGRIVAIDIDSGDFEIADGTLEAATKLLERNPQSQIWCVRIGHPFVHRFGSHRAGVRE